MKECCVLCGIGAFVFVMGHFMHRQNSAVQCLTAIYAAAIWFYTINILCNWRKILQKETTLYRFINFLHFVVSMKFVERIPYLSEFVNMENNERDHTQ
jgi:arginine exporter protein ArgO